MASHTRTPSHTETGHGVMASSRNTRTLESADPSTVMAHPEQTQSTRPRHTCEHCGQSISGQFVRALGVTFHIDCFTCQVCQRPVAQKFFPVDDEARPGRQYALCETHYFGRLDLLCHKCGGALRGSYITALDRKFHVEHFTCSVCPTVFGPQDSYYEHDGEVYCHYHFSMRHAQKCYGCQNSILKQFVEIMRNGQNQHWHPECYMIQKFWNVKLTQRDPAGDATAVGEQPSGPVDTLNADEMRMRELEMEDKVNQIWNVLSGFEESSASCISDMLLNVSNGAYIDGVLAAVKFIAHVEVLFAALDHLEEAILHHKSKELFYGREARMLCKKIISFFSLLSKTQEVGVRKLGITQELLSLVTGLAHYLKLLIRVSLNASLRLEREGARTPVVKEYLSKLGSLDLSPEKHPLPSLDSLQSRSRNGSLRPNGSTGDVATQQRTSSEDHCQVCRKLLEDECVIHSRRRFHIACLKCHRCQRVIDKQYHEASYNANTDQISCRQCTRSGAKEGFVYVTRLTQYVFLLRMALARLYNNLRRGPSLPHTSDDPNLDSYDSSKGHSTTQDPRSRRSSSQTRHPQTQPLSGDGASPEDGERYASAIGDIRRMRSTQIPGKAVDTAQKPRRSRVLNGPDGVTANQSEGDSGATSSPLSTIPADIEVEDEVGALSPTATTSGSLRQNGTRSITFEDLNKFVAAEQSKQRRPLSIWRKNKSKTGVGKDTVRKAPGDVKSSRSSADLPNVPDRQQIIGTNDSSLSLGTRAKAYFSELSALQLFIIRHIAVMSLEPLVKDYFSMEDLLELIETRKGGFWNKFSKAFNKQSKDEAAKAAKKKGIFGTSLEILCERASAESTQGIGPNPLKVPAFFDDIIVAMRGMDLSVEGIFRKNGNIRRLKDLAEQIDRSQGQVNLSEENPVQLAALLKKFLRDLPEPLMTNKLHRLFLVAQKIPDDEVKFRILHLTCCLLPRSHRDTLEVLMVFLNWSAQFAQVDEETGSKMDEHNLATVVAPNILYAKGREMGMEESFAAIESVYALIRFCEEFCCVPDDLMSMLHDTSLFASPADLTTKDILKRCEERLGHVRPSAISTGLTDGVANGSAAAENSNATRRPGVDRPKAPLRVDTGAEQLSASRNEHAATATAATMATGSASVGGMTSPTGQGFPATAPPNGHRRASPDPLPQQQQQQQQQQQTQQQQYQHARTQPSSPTTGTGFDRAASSPRIDGFVGPPGATGSRSLTSSPRR